MKSYQRSGEVGAGVGQRHRFINMLSWGSFLTAARIWKLTKQDWPVSALTRSTITNCLPPGVTACLWMVISWATASTTPYISFYCSVHHCVLHFELDIKCADLELGQRILLCCKNMAEVTQYEFKVIKHTVLYWSQSWTTISKVCQCSESQRLA